MTAQMPDSVRYEGREYSLAGVAGVGLFDPLLLGIRPTPLHTGNWRGYVCRYAVRDGRLHLDELELGWAGNPGVPPAIFGTESDSGPGAISARYRFPQAPIPFSGGLLLGEGFIAELYVHMGFHPGWKYERVVELVFAEGRLERARDHSETMARIRSEIVEGVRPDPDRGDLLRWIERTFELDYGRSFPE